MHSVSSTEISTDTTANYLNLSAIIVTLPIFAIVVGVAVMLAWRQGHKQRSKEIYAPTSSQDIIENQPIEKHNIIVSHGLQEVKEGWRSSFIEQHIELPVQKGVPALEVTV